MVSFIKTIMATIPRSIFFEIETDLGRSAVRNILEVEVMKPLPFGLARPWSRKFVGDVYPSEFDIKIEVWYNPGFNPVFHGSYRKADKGGVVGVKASNYYAAFATVMMWITSAVALYFAFSSAFHGDYRSAEYSQQSPLGLLRAPFLVVWFTVGPFAKADENLFQC